MALTILRANGTLSLDGHSYDGCPMLVRDGTLDPAPTYWFMHLWREFSSDTVAAYALSFKSWCLWLSFLDIEIWRTDINDLSRYKRALVGRRSTSSINVHVAAICAFYKWAFDSGLTYVLPFKLANVKADRTYPDVPEVPLVKVFECVPRTHTKAEFDTILASTKRADPGLRLRDELIAEFGRYCGFRRLEIASLTVSMIDEAKRSGAFFKVRLIRTKGNRPRSAYLPAALMNRVRRYITVYRARIVDRQQSKRKAYVKTDALFLTLHGRAIRRESITAAWAEASKSASIKSRFHDNRHTFGTHVVQASKKAGLHPLRLAQDLLGHASPETTAIYDHTEAVADDQSFFKGLVKGLQND